MSCNDKVCVKAASIELRAAFEVQQDLALIATLKSEIVWDVIGPDQSELLKRKLECMFPDDNKICTLKSDIRKVKKYNSNISEIRKKIFFNVWHQRKYTNGTLLHSIIYVIVTPEEDLEKAKFSHNYTIHPIFRTRRCINANSSAGCCMIFIDEKSRIYQNWNDFVNNNELPIGTMIAPSKGCYTINKDNLVELEFCLTPASYKKKLVAVDNFVASVSLIGLAATLLNPTCLGITIATKTYETIRNYQKTSDNIKRGTSTNLKRNLVLTENFISLTSSVVSFGAYMIVPPGRSLSLTTLTTIQTINSAATLVNSTKFIITIYDLFTRYFIEEEELEFTDALAFGTSLILLTNSINNVVLTSKLGKIGGNKLRSLLQSQIKAGLTLLSEEVNNCTGQNAGCFDLLRLVNDIPYKDVLCNINTVYNNLSRTGFLTTLSVLGAVAMEILPGLVINVVDKEIAELNLSELTKYYGFKFVRHISNSQNLIDVLNCIGVYFSMTIIQFFLNQTRLFIETCIATIDSQQHVYITTEMVLYKIFSFTLNNYKNYSFDFLESKRDDIILGVTEYFQSLNPKPLNEDCRHCCKICGGYYYLCI